MLLKEKSPINIPEHASLKSHSILSFRFLGRILREKYTLHPHARTAPNPPICAARRQRCRRCGASLRNNESGSSHPEIPRAPFFFMEEGHVGAPLFLVDRATSSVRPHVTTQHLRKIRGVGFHRVDCGRCCPTRRSPDSSYGCEGSSPGVLSWTDASWEAEGAGFDADPPWW